jgi:hypothetical protein
VVHNKRLTHVVPSPSGRYTFLESVPTGDYRIFQPQDSRRKKTALVEVIQPVPARFNTEMREELSS